jgi:hypothetical protein
MSGFGITMSQNVWTQFTATIDTSSPAVVLATTPPTPPGDCSPTAATPGALRQATIYLNQYGTGSPTVMPDLFLDDIVVQVTDGHNLIGNPNFEGGFVDGWTALGGVVGISSTIFHTGSHSLSTTGRTVATAGPTYALPTGAARYVVTFQGQHNGASAHGLILQPSYTCAGGTQTLPSPIAMAASVPASTWTQLSGMVTLPPADAPAGCHMVQAAVSMRQQETGACSTSGGTLECPDLFVDDASVTLAP